MNTQINEVAILKDTLITRIIMLDKEDNDFIENSILNKDAGENGYAYAWKYPGQAQVNGLLLNETFYPPKPHPAFMWNATYLRWDAPIEKPQDTETTVYVWNWLIFNWEAKPRPEVTVVEVPNE